MELFQLRVESGGGRAFTPSRGSMVVLTHVALVVEPNTGGTNKKKRDDASERVTVLVSSGGSPPVALGTVSDAPGMEQFSIGGSGLCFGDEKRVEVRHTGSSGACVCLTGRIEETYEGEMTSSDDEEYDGEGQEDDEEEEDSEDSEDSDEESDDSEESEEDADVMETVERYAARAAAARKAMDEADSDEDDDEVDEESSEDADDDDEEEDSEEDDDDSSSSDDYDESDSDESDDSDALPGSKRKGVSSEQARRESKFEDAREAKRSKGNFGRSKSFRRK